LAVSREISGTSQIAIEFGSDGRWGHENDNPQSATSSYGFSAQSPSAACIRPLISAVPLLSIDNPVERLTGCPSGRRLHFVFP
jgi:hypothetical protein